MLIALAVCAGCGSGGSSKKTSSTSDSKVSAGTYVGAVCSAIAPLEKDVVSAAEAKKNLRGFLAVVEQDSDHALARIQSAGTPDIKNGDAVAGKIVATFTELRDAMQSAVAKAASLPTGSPSSFQTAAQALLASVGSSLNKIDSSGLSNPDVEKAEASQSACKQLSSG
jgi:hypothetical protein